MTTTPLISSAMLTPITVMMGTAALRSACAIITARSVMPLARAVRMKSSPITSSTLLRAMRAIRATKPVLSARVGSSRCMPKAQRPADGAL
ncbi:hypothetical protein D3C72_1992080 [compost metagenome]